MKLWITPGYCWRTQGSRIRKIPAFEVSRYDLLREEGRRGTIVPVRVIDPVRVEPELAIVEAEERRAREVAIGVRCELVVAVGVELFPADVPLRMGQRDSADCQTSQTELVDDEDLAGPTDGSSAMA